MTETVERYAAVDLIIRKRDRGELTTSEINWLVDAYTRGYVLDEQMSAFTMSVLLNGMNRREIKDLTLAMIASGERLDFSNLGWKTVDKHSTGGVGDKITLPLLPLVASFGVAVPQLSGRGLGHTGGTLDKLESIPGWRANLSNAEMFDQLKRLRGVICAAGSGLAPADRKLYALRDITGTVEAIPLIASSIMSKKIAEGTDALVLDVKFGSGAFMKDYDRARELAQTMVELGKDAGVNTSALLTDMNVPLGLTIGNANEVRESVEVLAGGGPEDVVELTVALATEMLRLAGKPDEDVASALRDGRAMDAWRDIIRAQGGDPDAKLPTALHSHTVYATADDLERFSAAGSGAGSGSAESGSAESGSAESGAGSGSGSGAGADANNAAVLTKQDALQFGVAAWRLGAGRARKDDLVQHGAGIDLHVKPGDVVQVGQPLFTMHSDQEERFELALEALNGAWELGAVAPKRQLVVDRIQ